MNTRNINKAVLRSFIGQGQRVNRELERRVQEMKVQAKAEKQAKEAWLSLGDPKTPVKHKNRYQILKTQQKEG